MQCNTEEKEYICECGKILYSAQSFNGHKSNCKVHIIFKYGVDGYDRYLAKQKRATAASRESTRTKREQQKSIELTAWLTTEPRCEHCNNVMVEKFGSGRFCSRACANSRVKTAADKAKVSESLLSSEKLSRRKAEQRADYLLRPNSCVVCGSTLPWELRRARTCGSTACISRCNSCAGRAGGLKSVQMQSNTRRSKNEIEFAELCKEAFAEVSCNASMFDGWDADVIIHDYNIAVLWNGIWHYKKVREKHSVEQVQSRDRIKMQLIKANGYIPYVIKDLGKANSQFVREEFNKLIDYINQLEN
jgi:hypothetical protein